MPNRQSRKPIPRLVRTRVQSGPGDPTNKKEISADHRPKPPKVILRVNGPIHGKVLDKQVPEGAENNKGYPKNHQRDKDQVYDVSDGNGPVAEYSQGR